MADVTRVVETVFRVSNAGAVQALGGLSSAAREASSSIMSIAAPLTGLLSIGGGVMAARGLIQMQSAAEGTQQAIAGALSSFGVVRTFNEGLQQSASLMDVINTEAAALPGSAEDYVEVFRTALPAAMASGFRSLTDIAHFTDRMTAIAAANQESSQEAAMDMSRLLQGRAGVEVRLWRTLEPLIGRTAEQFNRMSAPARAQAMQGAISRYSDTLAHMGDTWDAISGTTSQYLVQITRAATMPLFSVAKNALGEINDWLQDNQALIQDIGRTITNTMVAGFHHAYEIVTQLGDALEGIGENLRRQPWFAQLVGRVGAIGHAAGQVSGGTLLRAGGAVAGLAAGGGGGLLLGAALGAFATHTKELTATLSNLGRVVNAVVGVAMHLWNAFHRVSTAAGNLLALVLPQLSGVLARVAELAGGVLGVALDLVAKGATELAAILGPVVSAHAAVLGAVSSVYDVLQAFLLVAVRWLGKELTALTALISGVVSPVFDAVATTIAGTVDFVASAFDTLIGGFTDTLGRAMNVIETGITSLVHLIQRIPGLGRVFGAFGAVGHAWANIGRHVYRAVSDELTHRRSTVQAHAVAAAQQAQAAATAAAPLGAHPTIPQARGGAHTVNDFRHSRFEIMQKFAEGFDPDRIAVAFVHDLERSADRRLSGQLEPQFAVR